MTASTVALAADHAGFELKDVLKGAIEQRGLEVLDLGTHDAGSVDYPDHRRCAGGSTGAGARRAAASWSAGPASASASRPIGIAHVRAALCHDVTTATLARQHNDANVLVLGARVVGLHVAADSLAGVPRHAVRGRPAPAAGGQAGLTRPCR